MTGALHKRSQPCVQPGSSPILPGASGSSGTEAKLGPIDAIDEAHATL